MFPKGQHSVANVQVQLGIAKRFVDYGFLTKLKGTPANPNRIIKLATKNQAL